MLLLIVDTQTGIMNDELYEFEKVSNNIKTLLNLARNNHHEVIFVRHDDGPNSGFSVGDEAFEIYHEFQPLDHEKIFDKKVNSAFHPSTGLCTYLKEKGVNKIITVGLATNFCMDATIKSGFEHGFEMIVPEYTNSTFDNNYMTKDVSYHFYNDFMWPDRYAHCCSMEEAMKALS